MYKQIKGFEGYYEVNEEGKVRSIKRKIWNGKGYFEKESVELKPQINKKGYLVCYLSKNSKQKTCLIHRLVAETFIPNPQKKEQVNHKDCNKKNNNVENLEWCTNLENQRHARENNLVRRWENAGRKKVPVVKIDINTKKILKIYSSISEAAKENNLNKANIRTVCENKRKRCGEYNWKYYKKESDNNE